MLGALSTPALGASPLSSWQPQPIPPLTIASYLAEDIDPRTGEVMSLTTGIDPTDATLITQMRTARGSGAAVLEDGHNLRKIEQNNEDAPQRIAFELTRVLAPFVARGEIVVLDTTIEAGPGFGDMGASSVLYRNARTSEERRAIPVG